MGDPIPPGHGEPEPSPNGRGSDTYTEEEYDDFDAWLRTVSMCKTKDEELIDFA